MNKAISSASSRIQLWDNIKFILIALVVVGHFADKFYSDSLMCRNLFLFIYAFHMPLFLYVSGLFHKNNKIPQRAMFYAGSGFALKIAVSLTKLILNSNGSFKLLSDSSIPWFMFVLAYYTVAAYLLRNQNKVYVLVFSVIIALFVGFDKSIGDYLYISRAVIFFPFYWLGVMTEPAMWTKLKEIKWLKIVSVLVIAGWIAASVLLSDQMHTFLRTYFTGRHPFPKRYNAFGSLFRLLAYAISSLTSGAIILLVPNKNIIGVSKCGKKTLNVYFWHSIVYMIVQHFTNVVSFCTSEPRRIWFLLSAVALSFLLSVIPVFDYPIKWIKHFTFFEKNNKNGCDKL